MGWEYRARGGPYYIRYAISNGRTIREYLGRGPIAEQAAREDAEVRAIRDQERAAWQHLETLDAQVTTLDRMVTVLLESTLLTAGYHQHHRGEWRKRRG
jgi:hypothetical protein